MAGFLQLRESFTREAAITLACTGTAALLIIGFAALLWECMIVPNELERALLNLVVDARDASEPHGPVEIDFANVPRREIDRAQWPDLDPGDYICCQVRDRGVGMAPDVVRRACEPFFTTKEKGRGTGLGLSQVFRCARQSGGGVRIESKPAAGTTIRLLLPRAADGADDHPAVSRPDVEHQSA